MKLNLAINNLGCAHCAEVIREKIDDLPEVKEVSLNFLTKKLSLDLKSEVQQESFITKLNILIDKIEKGVSVSLNKASHTPSHTHNHSHGDSCGCTGHSHEDKHHHSHKEGDSCCGGHQYLHEHNEACNCNSHHSKTNPIKKYIKTLKNASFNFDDMTLIIGSLLFITSFLIEKGPTKTIFSLILYILVGYDVLAKSLFNIKNKNFLDENFLMSIATIGALFLGEYSEAIGVMIFYKIGEFFQDKAVNNSRSSIESLLSLKVVTANLKKEDGSVISVSPESLKIGDIFVVKAGESIPLDGVIIKGDSSLNTAALTGESLPKNVSIDDNILSGSVNINGVLEVRVTKEYHDSTIYKIIQMIEEATDKKPEAQKFITKFAKYYTPFVVVLAIAIGLILPMFLGDFKLWFERALIFLVISCPCALVLSVPLTFFSSIGYASSRGILIKGGNYLEKLTEVDTIVFDKTGTLTENDFEIENIVSLGSYSQNEILEFAAAGEIYSNHPLARVILKANKTIIEENNINDYLEISGKGTTCNYKGQSILVGNKKLMMDNNINLDNLNLDEGSSLVFIGNNLKLIGYISFAGIIKPTSKESIKNLSSMKFKTFMLTGDNKKAATKVGSLIGLQEKNIYSDLLPQDKVSTLETIKSSSSGTIFVGDGINDAPSLSIADVGIAMGGMGSDIAIEAADIVLMEDNPSKVVELLKISKFNKSTVLQNVVFSLGIKVLVMILGVMGLANMWMAIFADVGVSFLAVLNAAKILKKKNL